MGEHFTMWIKINCPFCIAAREALFRHQVDHTIYVMDENLDELESLKENWGHPTVPIVVHQDGPSANKKLLGGYTELKERLDGKRDD